MEGAGSSHQDASNWIQVPDTQQHTKGKASTKRPSKDTKLKPNATAPGTRYQCPRCPKNFSRIENLTRHQANHDEVGKFACVVCRKRFTRSDLLNRHRRIHENQSESSQDHLTYEAEFSLSSTKSSPQASVNLVHRDKSRSVSEEGLRNPVEDLPGATFHNPIHQQQGLYANQDGYQHLLAHNPLSAPDPSTLSAISNQSQGLTSLMEAALAPQGPYTFTPVENLNPSLWDGFMVFGDNTNSYMGLYDADISWTLNWFQSEPSPNYFLGQDVMDFEGSPYEPQLPIYNQEGISQISTGGPNVDADAEDEDQNDWPDKISKPATPNRQPQFTESFRLVPDGPASWQSVIEEARRSGLSARTMRPNQQISDSVRTSILSALNGFRFVRDDFSRPEIRDRVFPPSEALDYFVRLYFQYIHPRFPVIHLPTFEIYPSPPLLLLAMMFLGSSHSKADQGRFLRLFHERLRVACIRMQEVDPKFLRSFDNILTSFLLCLAGTWSGSKQFYEFAEGGRGILVTACRRSRLLDCRPSAKVEIEHFQRPGITPLQSAWLAWVETEKRNRLGLSIYIFDCQYPALFNNQPYVSKAETTNCVFACPEKYWEAPSAESWKILVGQADMPPSTYYLPALNCCLLRKWVTPPPPFVKADEFGKILLIYALHTHIFEWRQSCSMLNPTGLMGTFGNHALPIGKGLKDRRRWLVDGLDSWGECYLDSNTSPAAKLLHRLGYVSLDVSLSDMHLVAGRSTHKHDGDFAEENLTCWANSEIADSTMSHIYDMLDICHNCIATGTVGNSSYEVAVCLFTGGIVCWAYAKLRIGADRGNVVQQVRRASMALKNMGCWRMTSMFGGILAGFEVGKVG